MRAHQSDGFVHHQEKPARVIEGLAVDTNLSGLNLYRSAPWNLRVDGDRTTINQAIDLPPATVTETGEELVKTLHPVIRAAAARNPS